MWPWSALPFLSKPSIATKLRFEPDYIETHVPKLRYALLPTVERETYRSFLWFSYSPGRFCGRGDCYPFQCTYSLKYNKRVVTPPTELCKKSKNVRILSWGVRRGIYWKGYFLAFVRAFLLETNELNVTFDWLSLHVSQTRNCSADFD